MTKLQAIWLALVMCAAGHAQDRCGAGKDTMVQALERVTASAGNPEIENGLELLKSACSQCITLGDAWYYRSVFEKRLGNARQADYALAKAKQMGSEAMDQGANPFQMAAPPKPGERFATAVRDKWALVVGCSQFRDSRHIFKLRYTTKDATSFAEVLKDPEAGKFKPDHVKEITDEEATTVRIKTELNLLARTAGPDDLVVIYFASHGSARDQDIAGVNYVMTYDTDATDMDTLYATALPMVEIADVIRTRVKSRKAVVFLDTCHSGGAFAAGPLAANGVNTAPHAAMLDRIREGVGRVIISSSQVGQSSWESPRLQHGYFTYYLVEAMKQNHGGNSIADIYRYLYEQVSKQVVADRHPPQTPVMARSELGADLVLGVAPTATAFNLYRLPAVLAGPAVLRGL